MKQIFSRHDTAIYDWIFWTSLLVTGLWFALKIAGVIKTPLWLELVPVAGIIFAAGVSFQKFEHVANDLHILKTDTKAEFKEIKEELKGHDKRLVRIEAKLTA